MTNLLERLTVAALALDCRINSAHRIYTNENQQKHQIGVRLAVVRIVRNELILTDGNQSAHQRKNHDDDVQKLLEGSLFFFFQLHQFLSGQLSRLIVPVFNRLGFLHRLLR